MTISHQAASFSPRTPRPLIKDYFAEADLNYYAPAPEQLGFHFERYDSFILTPLLRPEIRNASPSNRGHVTVYLPGFNQRLALLRADKNVVRYAQSEQVRHTSCTFLKMHCLKSSAQKL